MSKASILAVIAVAALTLVVPSLLSTAVPAFAQQAPTTRVGRVSIVEGTLAFY